MEKTLSADASHELARALQSAIRVMKQSDIDESLAGEFEIFEDALTRADSELDSCYSDLRPERIETMGIEEFETAEMFAAYLRDIIENDAAGAAHTLAEGMADIFEKYAAEGGRNFDKAEFLRIVRAA
jgi:hypothetical protein